jgi:uncharacterized membrane protein YcaP (DUF421 family)
VSFDTDPKGFDKMEFSDIFHTFYATLASIGLLFIITKFMGNKQISQLTLFDYINGITIGSIAAEMAVSDEVKDLWQPAIGIVLYGGVGILFSYLTMKSIKCRKIITGMPLTLIENGKINPDNLKTAKLDLGDLLTFARKAGYFDITKIDYAIFEYNGTVSFLAKAEENPITPKDLGVEMVQTKPPVNIIMDGEVMEEELKHIGKDMKWLSKRLHESGYSSPDKVFLGISDGRTAKFMGY